MTNRKTWLEFIFGIGFGIVLLLAFLTLMPLIGIARSDLAAAIAAGLAVALVTLFQYFVEIRRRA